MDQPITYLWQFPPDDFDRWQAAENAPRLCADYAEHLALLAIAQRDWEAKGHQVLRVPLSLDEMNARLASLGVPSTSEWRHSVLQIVAIELDADR